MNDAIVKRPYRSPLRQAQAEGTRQRIIDAGLALFAERGYPGTSVAGIAEAAGVSVETIYASVGSKRGIIDALLAQLAPESIAANVRAEVARRGGTPRATLETIAHVAATFWSRNGTLVGVLRGGVGDPEIGEAWLERQAARHRLIEGLVASWPSGSLRAGLTPAQATDIVWALTSDQLFTSLVEVRGWSVDALIAWTTETLIQALLGEDPVPPQRP
jgi:AcrR family transcriptional regulator